MKLNSKNSDIISYIVCIKIKNNFSERNIALENAILYERITEVNIT